MAQGDRLVGRVAALWRYPVKSMAGESLAEVDVSWHGLAGDRRWAFVRPGQEASPFPWLTARQRPDLVLHEPSLADPADPDGSAVAVRTPDGRVLDVTDPSLAEELAPGARVLRSGRGVYDELPLSLVSTAGLAALGALVGAPLGDRRFRPNLVVDTGDATGYPEDGWVGRTVRVGGLELRVDARDPRCGMITIDPDTAARDRTVLRAVNGERESCFGVYGSTAQPGRVRVGDDVVLLA